MAKKKTTKKTTKKAAKKAPAKKASAKSGTKKVAARSASRASRVEDAPETEAEPNAESSAAEKGAEPKAAEPKLSGAAKEASKVLSGEAPRTVAELGDDLASGKKSVAASAARVLDEIVATKPEAVVPIIDRYAVVIGGSDRRPAQSAAKALPLMARIAPARVARHLPRLKEAFTGATAPGRDGLVRTFAGLCTASVAYQKRLEDVLNQALSEADAKTLITWSEVVLPALKGEPHARARATVEGRLGRIPKVHAQKIADFLGIKLRLRYR